MLRRILVLVSLLLALASAALAGDSTRYLHVRIDQTGGDDEQVTVTVPVSLVMTVLPLLEKADDDRHARLSIADHGVEHEELAAILDRLKDARDGEEIAVPVDDPDTEAWASRRDGQLQVRVLEYDDPPARRHRGEGSGQVSTTLVRVPLELATAMARDQLDSDDLARVIEAMGRDGGEILVVEDEEETRIHIWIDQRSGTD